MKLLGRLITLACILAAPISNAGETPAGNATSDAKKSTETASPGYESAKQIKAMPPCKATVEEHASCYSIFRTADGKKFSIGSPAAMSEVVQFLETLKDGQSYEFPSVFLDYQKKNPVYETSEQLKAMPPCKATVEHIGVYDSRLTTADGKMFFIGSPAATQEVVQFLQTVKHGQTYEFPGVFLDYQKKK